MSGKREQTEKSEKIWDPVRGVERRGRSRKETRESNTSLLLNRPEVQEILNGGHRTGLFYPLPHVLM